MVFGYDYSLCTVEKGKCVALLHLNGEQELKMGPCSFRPWTAKVVFLKRYQCDVDHYLEIKYLDGNKEHLRGPATVFLDPTKHLEITEMEATKLTEYEAIVVYSKNNQLGKHSENDAGSIEVGSQEKSIESGTSKVTRRIVYGPTVFVPNENEWIHTFSWHGTLKNGKGSVTGYHNDEKVAHALNFSRLRLMPDQTYFTQREVRTKDDAVIDVHTMIFFEFYDVTKMLLHTNDPMSDIFNSISADIMTFGSERTYEEIMSDNAMLSKLETFPILTKRLEAIGYKLVKVVYRGYTSSNALKTMQEKSITVRTKLRLEAEQRKQESENTLTELQEREKQLVLENKQGEELALHEGKIKKMKRSQEMLELEERHKIEMNHLREKNTMILEKENKLNNEKLRYLQGLQELKVDLTKYLVAKEGKEPDFLMVNNSTESDKTNVPHLHLNVDR